MNKVLVLIFIVFIFVFSVLVYRTIDNNDGTVTIDVNGILVNAVIADDDVDRARGLSFIEELPFNEGMLFVFENEGRHSFWMKDTYISLDIIWLDKDKRVVHIEKNTTPENEESLIPEKEARYVLEVNSGFTDLVLLKLGDKVKFEFF